MTSPRYWTEHRDTLLSNGYDIIPIRPNEKRPVGEDWPNKDFTKFTGDRQGIGLRAGRAVILDLDIPDSLLSAELISLATSILGETIYRYGNTPKASLVYRNNLTGRNSDVPLITNHTLARVYEEVGRKPWRVEWQADGKQSVMFGIHPDTKKPYRWSGRSPLDVALDDLPQLDSLALVEFEASLEALLSDYCPGAGYTFGMGSGGGGGSSTELSLDNYRAPLDDITLEIATEHLDQLPNEYLEDYELWLQIGAAMHHQFSGSDEAYTVFDQWTSQSPFYESSDYTRGKWESFKRVDGQAVVSYRTIQKIVGTEKVQRRQNAMTQYRETVEAATTVDEFTKALRVIANDVDLTPNHRAAFVKPSKVKAKELELELTTASIRNQLTPQRTLTPKLTAWLREVYYSTNQGKMFIAGEQNKMCRSQEDFNAMMGRHIEPIRQALDRHVTPWQVATELEPVNMIHDSGYYPGKPNTFVSEGKRFINTYRFYAPGVTPTDKKGAQAAIDRFDHHLHFIGGEEYQLLVDYLSHIVQSPEIRTRWALVLQGPQGCGKSFIIDMMTAVLGAANVSRATSQLVQSPYNSWAQGAALKVIEEILISGQNRYQAMDALKSPITDNMITINEKYAKEKTIDNIGSWILNTNHSDAIPLEINGERRYAVIKIENRDMRQFDLDNPRYFKDLFKDIANHAGDIGHWLMTRTISDEFDPTGKAPLTAGTIAMANESKSEERRLIEECIEFHENALVTDQWISTTVLHRCVADELDRPHTSETLQRNVKRSLEALGYERTPRFFQLKHQGVKYKHTLWLKPGVDVEEIRDEVRDKICEYIDQETF